jgi:alpha-ribazole phosphatase
MKIILIRHGQTKGNLEKRYIGRTEESLCEAGINKLKELIQNDIYPKAEKIFISPMKRCLETAELIYPQMEYNLCPEFRECDFGEFENKNYKELADNPNYQKWVDSMGTLPFPGGESSESFKERCQKEYEKVINESKKVDCIAFVVHGGTIMSILEKYALPPKDFYQYQVGNAEGFYCSLMEDGIHLDVLDKLDNLYKLG